MFSIWLAADLRRLRRCWLSGLLPEQAGSRADEQQRQNRFAHLFRPERHEGLISHIQARVDAYWAAVS